MNLQTKNLFQTGLAVLCLVAGCMVGPDYQRPRTSADGTYHWLPPEWEGLSDPKDPNALNTWWKAFDDPVSDELVYRALKHNTDLIAASAAVEQARAALDQAFGARLPQVDYGFTRIRQNQSFNLPEPTGRVSFISQSYTQDLSISYMTDVFGKLRRSEQAARFNLFAEENARRALAHTVVAQVLLARIEVATQQRLLDISEQTIANWQRALEIIDRRYQQGLSEPVDVYIARENLANAKAQKVLIEQTLIVALNALDVLCGQVPATTDNLDRTLAVLPELGPVPVGLPAQLLDRRPDVLAAEMRLASANERIGVSIAQMYPDLALTATGGYASDNFRMITATENQIYGFVMNVAMPIFQGGQLKAGVRAAEAATRQAAANYEGVVLNAMREVEDALVRQQKLAERIDQLADYFEQAKAAERLAVDRYQRGLDKILLSLETERRRRQAENELVIAQGNLWRARVDLFLALGGDWGIETIEPENTIAASDK